MEIYLDTAKIEEIREAVKLGVIRGVTTNPSLMMRAGRSDYRQVTQEICYLVQGPISAEVTSEEAEGMVAEAEKIACWSPHVVIKVPVTEEGLQAIHILSQKAVQETICQDCGWEEECEMDRETAWRLAAAQGIRTNATLVFSPNQALLAAQAGATFVSPFIGRLDDIGHDGMEVLADIVEILEYYDLDALVIAASIRHPLHVTQAALAGAHIATVPYPVLLKMIKHPLTDVGIERFVADWKKVSG